MTVKVLPFSEGPYATRPLHVEDGIPVFSGTDAYVKNYEKIAHDHLAAIKPDSANPWTPDKLLIEMEQSRRDLIKKHVVPDARMLDVGVGLGRLLAPLDALERFGIDISMAFLKIAEAAGFEVAFSRIEDMPYRDGFFDAVSSCDVLEHVIDLHSCCKQIVRVLKPGGILIISVPYNQNLDGYLTYTEYEFVHLRSFSVAGLRLLFEKIYDCSYVEHNLIAPYYLGAHTINVQFPEKDSPLFQILDELGKSCPPIRRLREYLPIDQETLKALLDELLVNHPNEFERIKEYLIQPIEMNVVFRKRA